MTTPTASRIVIVAMLAALVAVPGAARAGGLRWAPQAVRVPGGGDTTAAVEVSTTKTAALWLGPAELVRVRATRGDVSRLRARRAFARGAARLVIDEIPITARDGVFLIEPPGPGATWELSASGPITIVVERAVPRSPRLAFEELQVRVLRWIDRGGALPALDVDDGGALALRLRAGAALARALAGASGSVRRALAAWRRLDATLALALVRPADDPYVLRTWLRPDGDTVDLGDGADYARASDGRDGAGPTWTVTAIGPGVLVVDARAVLPTDASTVELAVTRDGAPAGSRRGAARASRSVRRDDAVFPTATTSHAGRRIRTIVALAPGRHTYAITTSSSAFLRAETRTRRRRLRDLLGPDPTSAARRARATLAAERSRDAALVDALLAAALGETRRPGDLDASSLASAVRSLAEDPAAALRSLAEAAGDRGLADDVLDGAILALAPRLQPGTSTRRLLAARLRRGEPPAAVATALAAFAGGGDRSDALVAAERGWRAAPAWAPARAAVLDAFRDAEWRRLDPVATSASPSSWLESGAGDLPADEPGAGWTDLVELRPGIDTRIVASAADDDPDRLAVLRIFVATAPRQPGPVTVRVDGTPHAVLALTALERLEIAVRPGTHRISVDPLEGMRAFASVPGNVSGRRAVVRTLWPTVAADGAPLAYRLPAPQAGPVRIELRALLRRGDAVPARRIVWIHTDTGTPRRLVLDVRSPDEDARAIGPDTRDAAISAPVAAIVTLPADATRLWLVSDQPLLAHVAVRAAAAPRDHPRATASSAPAQTARAPHAGAGADLASVRRWSARIARAPGDLDAILARAGALLRIGETGAARRDLDLARALAPSDPRLRGLERDLAARVEPRHLPPQPAGSPIVDGAVLAPALTAVADADALAELRAIAIAYRTLGAGGAEPTRALEKRLARDDSAAASLVRARLRRLAGDPAGALRAAAPAIGQWQAAVEAFGDAAATDDDAQRALAPLVYGLAAELDRVDLPIVRRLRAVAARATRWEPVRATESSAGNESLTLRPAALDDDDALALRDALLAAPWPYPAAHVLAPGEGTILAIRGPRTIRPAVWCRRLWPSALPDTGTCALRVRIDRGAARTITVAHATATDLDPIEVPAGRHQIEVVLDGARDRGRDDESRVLAAVRFTSGKTPIAVTRPQQAFLARADRPIEVVVAGPGALAIELRGYAAPYAPVDVTVAPPRSPARTLVAALDATAASTVRGAAERDVSVTEATTTIVALAEPGPHRIRIHPRKGTVAARIAVRVATRAGADAALTAQGDDADLALPWPATTITPTLDARTPRLPGGPTPSVELVIGHDDLDELDQDLAPLGLRVELAGQLRRRLGHVFTRVELRGRRLGELAPTALVRTTLELRTGAASAALDALAGVENAPSGQVRAARLTARADLRLLDGRRTELLLGASARASALDTAADSDETDPLLAGDYLRTHPRQLALRLTTRWRPLADQLATARLEARSNADPSIDQIAADLTWRGLVELGTLRGPIASLGYRPSYRLADADRAHAFWRHDLDASLSVTFAHVTLALVGDLYLPSTGGSASAIRLVARFDLDRRGGVDFTPAEMPLADFALGRSWTDEP